MDNVKHRCPLSADNPVDNVNLVVRESPDNFADKRNFSLSVVRGQLRGQIYLKVLYMSTLSCVHTLRTRGDGVRPLVP